MTHPTTALKKGAMTRRRDVEGLENRVEKVEKLLLKVRVRFVAWFLSFIVRNGSSVRTKTY
jgi:hypothetical protein